MTDTVYGYPSPDDEYIPAQEPGESGVYDTIISGPAGPYGRNLIPFQYQIGAVVFGYNTQIPVSDIQVQTYNQNKQDFQIIRTNETQFGIDTLIPGTIQFKMAVLDNYPLPNMLGLTDTELPPSLFARRGVLLPQLQKEWKALEVIPIWGEIKPIYFCDADGVTRFIAGRPGKFQYSRQTRLRAWYDVTAEFRRSDTFAYTDNEFYVGPMPPNASPIVATRGEGDADAWFRILLFGPFTNPIVTFGDSSIELNVIIEDGVVLEISSYPWARRIVDSNGNNWRANVIGETVYLDQLVFPAGTGMPVSWTTQSGTETNADTQMAFLWRESYNVM